MESYIWTCFYFICSWWAFLRILQIDEILWRNLQGIFLQHTCQHNHIITAYVKKYAHSSVMRCNGYNMWVSGGSIWSIHPYSSGLLQSQPGASIVILKNMGKTLYQPTTEWKPHTYFSGCTARRQVHMSCGPKCNITLLSKCVPGK